MRVSTDTQERDSQAFTQVVNAPSSQSLRAAHISVIDVGSESRWQKENLQISIKIISMYKNWTITKTRDQV